MKIWIAVFLAPFYSGRALACEKYKALDMIEMKEYRDKLVQPDADPLDQLFAFRELSCSDQPTIRAFAIREGLKSASDDLVRHEIMFEALMQMSRIDVELVTTKECIQGGQVVH
ncbi:MAG: hypothetical protein Kow0026_22140 [Oricola sp.]